MNPNDPIDDQQRITAATRRVVGFSALRRLAQFARSENRQEEHERALARRLAVVSAVLVVMLLAFLFAYLFR